MEFAEKNKTAFGLLFCLLAGGLSGNLQAGAEDNKGTTKVIHRSRGPKVPARNSASAQDLKSPERPPDMPGITLPNGKFLYGYNIENKNGGRNLGARFEVADQGPSVINYYKTALKSSGWNVNEEGAKENEVVASHPQFKATVTITTYPSTSRPGCQAYFSYGTHK